MDLELFPTTGAIFRIGNGLLVNPWKDRGSLGSNVRFPNSRMGLKEGFGVVALLRKEDMSRWNVELLEEICEPDSVATICQVKWPVSTCKDKLLWNICSGGSFTIHDCYLVTILERLEENLDVVWKAIWKSSLHECLKIHLWRLVTEVIPTSIIIQSRNGGRESCCVLCGEMEESYLHLFKNCNVARGLAFGSKRGCRLDHWDFEIFHQFIVFCISPGIAARLPGVSEKFFSIFMAAFLHCLWAAHNRLLFKEQFAFPKVIRNFNFIVEEFLQVAEQSVDKRFGGRVGLRPKGGEESKMWDPPPAGFINVNTDAAWSRGCVSLSSQEVFCIW